MSALTGPALVAAALLALAGAQKVLDPAMTVGALRSLGWSVPSSVVRLGSLAELCLGAAAIVVGHALLWWLVAVSYVSFSVFVVAALRKGTMIGSCGCFGREDTPPHPSHVLLNLALAGVAVAAATMPSSAVDELTAHPGAGVAVVALAGMALFLLYAAYVEMPRALAAGRQVRRA